MKKWMIALTVLFTTTVAANAMSYEQARDQALFLTDKMAYELNLTQDQYEAAYEINLDYLLSIDNYDDLYGTYWTRRNLDLSYILLDWQYRAYCAANYFYRPIYWDAGYWHFSVYARYPHRTYFYFGRPNFYWTYRGAHSWHVNGGRSWYHGRAFGRDHRIAHNSRGIGMRNGFDRGDYRNLSGHFSRNHGGRGLERINAPRERGRIESNRGGSINRGSINRSIENRRHSDVGTRSGGGYNYGNSGRFGGSRESSTRSTVGSRSYPGSSSQMRSGSTNRSYSTPNRTFSPSRSSSSGSSFSRGSSSRSSGFSSHSSGSRGGGMTRGGGSSHSGGSRGGNSGGGHFGGHR